MIPSDPAQAQIEYWEAVLQSLIAAHGREPADAFRSVAAYRDRMTSVGALDAVYHWEPEETAEAIVGRGYQTDPSDVGRPR